MLGAILAVFIVGYLRYGLGLINISAQVMMIIIGLLLIGSCLLYTSLTLYIAQLIFNFFWMIIFFNARNYVFAFIWLAVLWLMVFFMIRSMRLVKPCLLYTSRCV